MNPRVPLLAGMLAGGVLVYRERRMKKAIERFAGTALETLLNAIDANDEGTGMHVRRVAAGALIIADAAGLDERGLRAVERVGLFHDIGKIHEAISDIVNEPRRLTPAERRQILTHPRRGADVLAPLAAFYPELPEGVLSHHERWNGRGYPRRLRGRQIPIEARIVSIADTFDAVTHNREYRKGSGVEKAIQILAEGRGTQFDPDLIDLTLLPPVIGALARVRITRGKRRHGPVKRHHQDVPDVSFRWRSESLGSRRIASGEVK